MAINRNGYIGPFRGKLGPAVGSIWRGIQVIKALPAPSDEPRSLKQQQLKFGLVTNFLGSMSEYIKLRYQKHKTGPTPMNVAVGYHLNNAVIGAFPNYRIDYQKVCLTDPGPKKIDELQLPVLTVLPQYELKMDWVYEPIKTHSNGTDDVKIVFYSEASNTFITNGSGYIRDDKSLLMSFPDFLAGDLLHGWAFLVSKDQKTLSASVYLRSVTVKL